MTPEVAGALVAIVEDDAAIAEGLALNLELLGYRTKMFGDGESAKRELESVPAALVLLDISLPGHSGLWVLERLREAGNHVPVIVLSARQDEYDKVAALRLGADDYVTKPFALAELLARVAAVLRRARLSAAGGAETAAAGAESREDPAAEEGLILHFGEIVVDLDTRTVTRAGAPVRLTHLEFELLRFFCVSARRVYSREQLLREVWGMRQAAGTARTVDNFLAQLRAKLEADPERPRHLLTVRGSGYRFAPD
jgi:two-component system alkaline phosphatase synthesis response regulator PhoP